MLLRSLLLPFFTSEKHERTRSSHSLSPGGHAGRTVIWRHVEAEAPAELRTEYVRLKEPGRLVLQGQMRVRVHI
jgi:hypothetical protein